MNRKTTLFGVLALGHALCFSQTAAAEPRPYVAAVHGKGRFLNLESTGSLPVMLEDAPVTNMLGLRAGWPVGSKASVHLGSFLPRPVSAVKDYDARDWVRQFYGAVTLPGWSSEYYSFTYEDRAPGALDGGAFPGEGYQLGNGWRTKGSQRRLARSKDQRVSRQVQYFRLGRPIKSGQLKGATLGLQVTRFQLPGTLSTPGETWASSLGFELPVSDAKYTGTAAFLCICATNAFLMDIEGEESTLLGGIPARGRGAVRWRPMTGDFAGDTGIARSPPPSRTDQRDFAMISGVDGLEPRAT